MAYLHCHACNWSQDDFWSKTYNPVTCFQDDLEELLTGDLNEKIEMDSAWLSDNHLIDHPTRRYLILHHLNQLKARIETMVYRTDEEFRTLNAEGRCPNCGKVGGLDID